MHGGCLAGGSGSWFLVQDRSVYLQWFLFINETEIL